MPWQTQKLNEMVQTAKSLVAKTFNIISSDLKTQIFIAQRDELEEEILDELKKLNYSVESISKIKNYYLPFVIGKFFKCTNEIWILHGKGENIDTIVHEFLHSIQKCEPNRKEIADYLTYKITGNLKYINSYDLIDWQEIEKSVSYQQIKERLITEGDCQDF
ncbi:MAG: hypothetical protein ACTSWY_05080 [Promethearchaeota archaeon]